MARISYWAMIQSLKSFSLLAMCLIAGVTVAAQTKPADIQFNQNNRVHFIAYGDTRFTNPAATNAANPQARHELVQAIAHAHPEFVTFGGDITYNGNDPNDWKVYDQETTIWREQH